ncbi:MFS transporter [Advenella sp. RU8]|uniref:MFS transporter n=1 Tax=Advenella sp. RU8 TaxID=3399575 RepID=UPI003AAE9E03
MKQQAASHQFSLLQKRCFAPFFWTQFCGAANDNLYKFAVTILLTYQWQSQWFPSNMAGVIIGGLFILPFLLFSATSGQLSDQYDKIRIMRNVKNAEIGIMLIATYGIYLQSVLILLACIFLMGLHSALFGPAKYAYLPQVLENKSLMGGNALVSMGTFVSILLGNIAGGVLVAIPGNGHLWAALACLLLAVGGRISAQFIPPLATKPVNTGINWNPFTETIKNLAIARENRLIFKSMLLISWMWFFGAVFIALFPIFAKDILKGNEHVAALLLVLFSIGVATGSLSCEKLGLHRPGLSLVPLGAAGMSLFTIDLYFSITTPDSPELRTFSQFIAQPANWRTMFDLFMLSACAGLYSVPLYTFIQKTTLKTHTARIIAANNILNAIFLIASALATGFLLSLNLSVPLIFLLAGIVNILFSYAIFLTEPGFKKNA